MMHRKKIIYIFAVLLIGGVILLVRDHEKKINSHRELATSAAGKLQTPVSSQKPMNIDGLNLSQGEAGKLEWKLQTEQAETDDESGVIKVLNPFLTYFYKDAQAAGGQNIITVKGLHGELDQTSKNMRFIDEVLVVNNIDQITTSLLEFVYSEKIIYCPAQTFFSSPTMHGVAGKASLNLNNNIFNASGRVTVNVILAPSEKMKKQDLPDAAKK
jgi:hypothetical protein